MPKNSKVGMMYDAMVREEMDKRKAARIAQSKTGTSLATGRKAKGKKGKGDAKMKAKQRNALPASKFGEPGPRKYPVNDQAHAANAKARATQQVKKGNLSASEAAKIKAKANKVLGKRK